MIALIATSTANLKAQNLTTSTGNIISTDNPYNFMIKDIKNANINVMQITKSGRFGLGVTSPVSFFQLKNNLNIPTFYMEKKSVNNPSLTWSFGIDPDEDGYLNFTTNKFNYKFDKDVEFTNGVIRSGQGSYLYFQTDGLRSVNRMVITGDGRVGINTETPTEMLNVVGNIKATGKIICDELQVTKPLQVNSVINTSEVLTISRNDITPLDFKPGNDPLCQWRLGTYSNAHAGNRNFYLQNLITQKEVITVTQEGFVGIGTSKPQSLLSVNGTITSKEIIVTVDGWADYVFEKDYKLPSLASVEKYIKEKGHLPEIPSAKEVKENGVNVAEMNAKLLQKIEELTLYVIEQQKEINDFKKQIINGDK